VLATHPEIDTASEPWILLPLLYSLRRQGVYAEYGHKLAATAIEDFANGLPGGRDTYLQEIKRHALRLYTLRAKPGANYFVDKSPRYHLVAEEIIQTFDSGKFIFLWRNPLAIVASIMETWENGRWNIYGYYTDIYSGLTSLVEAFCLHKSRSVSVRFEDIAAGDEKTWRCVHSYLGVEFLPQQLTGFTKTELTGEMGDTVGRVAYAALTTEPLHKWKKVITNPFRKWWCRKYLFWIGHERLAVMGYDLDQLLKELDSVSVNGKFLFSDLFRWLYGSALIVFQPWILRECLLRAMAGEHLRILR
jgi:Sulfotransferase family